MLVTHGTDTMIETALGLNADPRIAGSSKTIIVLGSFKPECFKASDATFNVGVAIGALEVGKEKSMVWMVEHSILIDRQLSIG